MMQMYSRLNEKVDAWAPLIARVFIAGIFLWAGYGKLEKFSDFAAQLGTVLPLLPGTAWAALAVIFEFGGALLLLIGYKTREAAWMLIVFTLIATVIAHTSILAPAGTLFQIDWSNALKNLAVIGGLLLVGRVGSSCLSLDMKMKERMGGIM